MERFVTFSPECAYDSAAYNADDVNKLFGLSFGLGGCDFVNPHDLDKGFFGYFEPQHWNSARFGWRWSKSDQCIELLAYCYNQGKKNWDEQLRFPVVAQVKPGEQVLCTIELDHDPEFGQPIYRFSVTKASAPFTLIKEVNAPENLPHYGFTQGLYFGGDLTAPHDMSVQIDRV